MPDINITIQEGELITALIEDDEPIPFISVAKQGLPGPPGPEAPLPTQFGNVDEGNFSSFDENGFLTFHGDARIYRDELGDALSLKSVGPRVTINDIESLVEFSATAGMTDYLFKNLQLNHDRELGTPIQPHLHFFQGASVVPNFLLQYRWVKLGEQKPVPWTNIACNVPVFPYTSGVLSQIATVPELIEPPTGDGVSDIVQFRVIRDNSNISGEFVGADSYSGSVGILSFDVHIIADSIGSKSIMAK
jgi:hypothetical protein